jgi:PAS domain S-box-containing protein
MQKQPHLIINDLLQELGASGFIINNEWEVMYWFGDNTPFLQVANGLSSLRIHHLIHPLLLKHVQKGMQKISSSSTICLQSIDFKDHSLYLKIKLFYYDDNPYYLITLHIINNQSVKLSLQSQLNQENNIDPHYLHLLFDSKKKMNKSLQKKQSKLRDATLEQFISNLEDKSILDYSKAFSEKKRKLKEVLLPKTEYAIQSDTIIDFIREPLFTINAELKIIRANASFFKYFLTSADEVLGNKLYELDNGFKKNHEFQQLFEVYLHTYKKIEDYELTITFASIGTRTILINAKQISKRDLKDIINVVSIEDITELKISRLLRDSEESYRVLADAAPVLLWVSEIDGGISFFNKSWLNFTGKSFHEQKGKGWITSIYPEDRSRIIKEFKQNILLKKEFKQEFRLRRNDGEYRWISVKGVPRISGDGDFLGFIGGCMDIDDQKNFSNILEEKITYHTRQLRESRSFLQSILDMTQNLIYIYDFKKKKITFINSKAVDYTGFTPKEIEENPKDIFTPLIHPEDLKKVLEMRKTLEDNQQNTQMITIEYQIKNKNGEYIYQLSRGLVFKKNKKGQPLQYIEVSTDITELKLTNELLLSKNKELEHRNQELASFTSIASHDLKEPLRKIQMFSKLLLTREKQNVSLESIRFLERLDISASRMQQLIEDLISYSRTGNEKTAFIATDLNVILNEIIDEYKDNLEEKGATVELTDLPFAPTIPSQIQQLFSNLLGNAIKYNDPNRALKIYIRCEITTEEEKDEWQLDQEMNYFRITVEDNGIGFSNIYQEKIFEPFQRLHGKDEYTGTGIGLAICKKIMINHYGMIRAEGKEGKGSKFIIYLPYQNF